MTKKEGDAFLEFIHKCFGYSKTPEVDIDEYGEYRNHLSVGWAAACEYKDEEHEMRASILISVLEEISKSTYEANPWTIVKTKDAEIADKALLKYKGVENELGFN